MHPVSHLLLSWSVADLADLEPRDRALVTWCGVAPDLDALGLLFDLANAAMGRPSAGYYHEYHHFLTHGLPAALVLSVLFSLFARRRGWVLLEGLLVFHLHLLCDLAGSRGPSPTDLWPIYYLAPVTRRPMIVWEGQWRLDGWQNFTVTVLLLGFVGWRAETRGRSPVGLISVRADQAVVQTLQRRWQSWRGGG